MRAVVLPALLLLLLTALLVASDDTADETAYPSYAARWRFDTTFSVRDVVNGEPTTIRGSVTLREGDQIDEVVERAMRDKSVPQRLSWVPSMVYRDSSRLLTASRKKAAAARVLTSNGQATGGLGHTESVLRSHGVRELTGDARAQWASDYEIMGRPLMQTTITKTQPPLILSVMHNEQTVMLLRSGLWAQTETAVFHRILHERCKQLPAPLVVDVGANFGYFGLMAASLGCRAWLFEPIPSLASLIRFNAALNGLERLVRVFENPVMSKSGAPYVLVTETFMGSAVRPAGVGEEPDIESVALQDLIDEDVLLIKIDVEGLQQEVLQGMEDLFAKHHVSNVVIEILPEHVVPVARRTPQRDSIEWLWTHFEKQGAVRAVNWREEYLTRIPPTFNFDPKSQCNMVEMERSWSHVTQPEVWFTSDVEEIERLGRPKSQLPAGEEADLNPDCFFRQHQLYRYPYFETDYWKSLTA